VRLPRAIVGGMASWLPETGGGTDADQTLDSFTVVPKRISGSTVKDIIINADSSDDARHKVQDMFPDAVVTGVRKAH